MPIGRVA